MATSQPKNVRLRQMPKPLTVLVVVEMLPRHEKQIVENLSLGVWDL